MAAAFAEAMADVNGAELHAVGSRRQATADSFAGRYGILRSYGSYERLLDDADIDIVYIATPHSLHHENCLQSLDAGKAVLCEKPFALNATQASEMIARAEEKNCFLMEAMWTRFLPAVVKLRDLLQDDVLGDIQTIVAGGAFMPPFDPDKYLFNRELGGGVLLDAGVYLISIASMILGAPATVSAAATLHPAGIDDNDAILLSHGGGANALLYVSLHARSAPDLRILGKRGEIHVHAPIFSPAKLTLRLHDQDKQDFDLPFTGNGYQYQVDEVVHCLQLGKCESEIMPLAETLSIMETMDAVRRQIGLTYPQEN